jgi:hypothetical protein
VNALLFAEINDFLLREVRVVLDLVHRGDGGGLPQELG